MLRKRRPTRVTAFVLRVKITHTSGVTTAAEVAGVHRFVVAKGRAADEGVQSGDVRLWERKRLFVDVPPHV